MKTLKGSPLYDIALGAAAVGCGLVVVIAEVVGLAVLLVKVAEVMR